MAPNGTLMIDSWKVTGPTYELRDPTTQKWTKDVARALDRGFNAVVGAPTREEYAEPPVDRLQAWPEAVNALQRKRYVTTSAMRPILRQSFPPRFRWTARFCSRPLTTAPSRARFGASAH